MVMLSDLAPREHYMANGYILIYAKEYLKNYHEDRQN